MAKHPDPIMQDPEERDPMDHPADQALANARVAYEHVTKVYDDTVAAQVRFLDRANKMLLIIVVLFAGLSYGTRDLVWILTQRIPCQVLAVVCAGLGIVAALALAWSFLCGIHCYKLGPTPVPGTKKLVEWLSKRTLNDKTTTVLLGELAQAVDCAHKACHKDEARRTKWENRRNRGLLAGFVSAVLFIGSSAGTRMFLVERSRTPGADQLTNATKTGDCDMTDENQPQKEDEKKQTEETDKDKPEVEDVIDKPRVIRGSRDGRGKENNSRR